MVAPEVVGAVRPGARLGFCPRVAAPPEVGAEGLVALDPGPDEAGAEGLVVNPDPGRADGTAEGFGRAVDEPALSPPEVLVPAPEPSPPAEVADPAPAAPAAEPAEAPDAPPADPAPPPPPAPPGQRTRVNGT